VGLSDAKLQRITRHVQRETGAIYQHRARDKQPTEQYQIACRPATSEGANVEPQLKMMRKQWFGEIRVHFGAEIEGAGQQGKRCHPQ